MFRNGIHFVFVLFFSTILNSAQASLIQFSDEATFKSSAGLSLTLESFEFLPVDSRTAQHTQLDLSGFSLLAPSSNLSVFKKKSSGQAATDGDNYVKYSSSSTDGGAFTLNFLNPVNWVGLNIIDWGERGIGELSLSASSGEALLIATTPQDDASVLFAGIASSLPLDFITISHDLPRESWALDEVYFGLEHKAAVPEPATGYLLASVLLALVIRRINGIDHGFVEHHDNDVRISRQGA